MQKRRKELIQGFLNDKSQAECVEGWDGQHFRNAMQKKGSKNVKLEIEEDGSVSQVGEKENYSSLPDLRPMEWKWFNGRDCIGVVFAYDRNNDMYHGYIGVGEGRSEERDVWKIINYGCRLTQNETYYMIGSMKARRLIDSIPEKKWKT